jgi:Kef-type K+ transport system membrane component KefB
VGAAALVDATALVAPPGAHARNQRRRRVVSGGPRPSPVAIGQGLLALALTALVWTLLRRADIVPQHGGALFALGLLVLAGTVAGSLAAFVGLPRLTGYLLAGIVCGPQGLALFSTGEVKALSLVNGLALALIALQAGAEITVGTLGRIWRSVLASSIAQIALVIAPMAVVFALLAPKIPFAASFQGAPLVALAVLWGVFMLTRSPTVTLAVLTETRAKGPLAEHALGVVVLLDVLVLPLFAAALAFARGEMLGATFELHSFAVLGEELFASMCAGVTFGLVLALLLKLTRERVLVLVGFGYAVTAISTYLDYDTLLVFVVAGFVITNLTRLGEEVVHAAERLAAVVMVVFFATAGAKLDLEALRTLWPVAIAFFVARVVVTIVSTRLGHIIAKDPPVVRRGAWYAFVSQAGVTIGLATIVADALPGVGRAFASLVIAVVGLNEVAGAVMFKFALGRAKEIPSHAPNAPPAPHAAPAPHAPHAPHGS